MILQYNRIAYYRDLQGRYYRAALGYPDEIIPDGVDASSDCDCDFYIDHPVDEYSGLYDILEGDERVLEARRKLRQFRIEREYRQQPQPIRRKLP